MEDMAMGKEINQAAKNQKDLKIIQDIYRTQS